MSLLKLPLFEMDGKWWRYEGNDEYRYLLECSSKDPKVSKHTHPLVCIGANSSTAVPGSLDPTLKTVERIAKRNGYDGFIMLNLSPIRATDPKNLPKTQSEEMYRTNIEWIEDILQIYPDVYCAWGNLVKVRPYMNIFKDLRIPERTNWLCRGPISKNGHPHHPLYVRDDEPLLLFPMEDYLKKMRGE